MGNQLSNESGSKGVTRTFGRTGALGLTRQELEKRCAPSGLYPSCYWEDKAIRRLIGDGRLAARLKGNEGRKGVADQECPICFLNYSQINVTLCCKANICTECFLQVRPQKEKFSVCPFCNNPKMYVTIGKRMDVQSIMEREEIDQKKIEASIKARNEEEDATAAVAASAAETVTPGGFGSNLEQDPAVLRARARTQSTDLTNTCTNELHLIRQLSLSSCDRQALEREMRAQHTHPLALQMEAEAAERRIANEREFQRNNPHRAMRSGNRSGSLRNRLTRMNPEGNRSGRRNWNEMIENFERSGGNGEDINSLDDLVVMEAAIRLSMEEDAHYRPPGGAAAAEGGAARPPRDVDDSARAMNYTPGMSRRRFRGGRNSERNMTEEEQVAMAIALSMQEHRKAEEEEEEQVEEGEENEEEQVVFEKVGEDDADAPKESAPPKPAAASLPVVSEDSDGADEEAIPKEDQKVAAAASTELKGKTSMDDSEYYRMTGASPEDDAISQESTEEQKPAAIETISEPSAASEVVVETEAASVPEVVTPVTPEIAEVAKTTEAAAATTASI